jgi:hypothetical protein
VHHLQPILFYAIPPHLPHHLHLYIVPLIYCLLYPFQKER